MTRSRILIADNYPALLRRIGVLLASEFEVVATVEDGQSALDAAVALLPDLVLLDISMPGLSGLQVAVRLSVLPVPPRIVLLSAHEGRAYIGAAQEAGASGYVFKQNIVTDLIPALHEVLAGRLAFPVDARDGKEATVLD
jgi:DNA-binding NarL/FixJ family response regulator